MSSNCTLHCLLHLGHQPLYDEPVHVGEVVVGEVEGVELAAVSNGSAKVIGLVGSELHMAHIQRLHLKGNVSKILHWNRGEIVVGQVKVLQTWSGSCPS